MLSHNFTASSYGNAQRELLMILDPETPVEDGGREGVRMAWVTHPEESQTGTCVICEGYEGEYDPEDLPDAVPGGVHPRCYCTWEVRGLVS